MKKTIDSLWFGRLFLFLIGTSLVLGGLATLKRDRLFYRNYWGGLVFAPLGILIGIFFLTLLVWKWNKLNERLPPLKGKAARLAKKADDTKFPIDDFRKW